MQRIGLSSLALVAALISAACSESASAPVSQLPPVGRFNLQAAAGQSLPSSVFNGVVLGDNDGFFRLELTATGGYFELSPDGHYEHRVFHDIRVDGQRAGNNNYVDRGQCSWVGQQASCISSYNQNVSFVASISANHFDLVQDLVGEGFPISYRYSLD